MVAVGVTEGRGTKNIWGNAPGHRWLLTLRPYNTQTLRMEADLSVFMEEPSHVKWDAVGLSEVRRLVGSKKS